MGSADRREEQATRRGRDRHAGQLRGVRFTDDEWARLAAVATYYGTSRTRLVTDYGRYLIGDLDELLERPPPGVVAPDDPAKGTTAGAETDA